MAFPVSTRPGGTLITASIWNNDVVANLNTLRTGGLALASQAAGDLLYASGSDQLARLPITNNRVLISNGGTPTWAANLPYVNLPTSSGTWNVGGPNVITVVGKMNFLADSVAAHEQGIFQVTGNREQLLVYIRQQHASGYGLYHSGRARFDNSGLTGGVFEVSDGGSLAHLPLLWGAGHGTESARLHGGPGAPVAGQLRFGDGTGWRLEFARVNGTVVAHLTDSGRIVAGDIDISGVADLAVIDSGAFISNVDIIKAVPTIAFVNTASGNKNWIIELSGNDMYFTEVGVATRLSLAAGIGVGINGDLAHSGGTVLGYSGSHAPGGTLYEILNALSAALDS